MPLSESEAKVILEKLHVPEDNWINPKIGLRDSPLGGKGMFAKEIIPEGETVIVWGGTPHSLFTEEDVRQGRSTSPEHQMSHGKLPIISIILATQTYGCKMP
ncbi:MAG: hypothetical protein UU78_C0035G0005 [Candidatus Roizmanbacteria bacterium GW2011_GWC2_41_7]|uniref:Uncharacterized protein n=1 Tax=Candidatus Roizmanbacteria bacterium GW2011_GWC2_41_7 TaxID=1618487 RepID=A0A0G1A8G8_9BACT|nr:MAG: hypothetical protein UU78_C0035G0005 [Candidatus Roizmanbacteria bacterium GW2011_GWC2_41_7]